MASYKILSDNCTLGAQGSTVQEKDLEGFAVGALIDGGHLEEVIASKPIKEQEPKKENN